MEYVYATMILHSIGKEITADGIRSILEAGDIAVNESKLNVLVDCITDVDIAEVTKNFEVPSQDVEIIDDIDVEEKTEEKTEDDEENKENLTMGIESLFG